MARTLSDEDLQAIRTAIVTEVHCHCSIGLSVEEAGVLKKFLRAWNRSTHVIGTVILTAVVIAILGIFSKGFWLSLMEGVKK